jgi:hypothetical protein
MALTRLSKPVWVWLCTLLCVSSLSVACLSATFVIQQYDGDPLPMDRIAILRLVGGDDAYLASLDGEGLDFRVEGRTDRIHIEMLPGDHELGIARQPNGRVVYRRFTAKAGVIYQPKVLHNRLARGEAGLERWTAGIFEVASGTDELVRDVSVSPYSPLSPAPEPRIAPGSPQQTFAPPEASPSVSSAPSESGPPFPSALPESAPTASALPFEPPPPSSTGAAPNAPPAASSALPAPSPPASAPLADPLDDRLPKPPADPAPSSPPVPTSPPAPAPPVPTSPPPPVPTTPPHPGPPPEPKSNQR